LFCAERRNKSKYLAASIIMRQLGTLSLIVCLAAASGCNFGPWGKRATELEGPTDIRRSHFWCLGEDAVFEQPLGPSRDDYGLKPTCWREWPEGGARCTDPAKCLGGSCVPAMPGVPIDQHAPMPSWEQTLPKASGPQPNPFLDDVPTLPTPAGKGAQSPMRAGSQPAKIVARPSILGPDFGANAAPTGQARSATAPKPAAPSPSLVRPTITTPQAAAQPQLASPPRPAPANQAAPLKITVSEPMDTPAAYFAPVQAPPAGPAITAANRSAIQADTLAGLERMMDIPNQTQPDSPRPMVVQNNYAPATKPFRLATRNTMQDAINDSELQGKTLSALGSMMSHDAPPAAK
jgi:hypothetical protein